MITGAILSEKLTALVGLSPCELRDLGPVVLLAGPNGGGKSRYLRLLRAVAKHAGTSKVAVDAKRNEVAAFQQLLDLQRAQGVPEAKQIREFLEAKRGELRDLEAAEGAVAWTTAPAGYPLLDLARVGLEAGLMRVPNFSGEDDEPIATLATRREKALEQYARALYNASHQLMQDNADVQKLGARARAISDVLKVIIGSGLGFDIAGTDPEPKATLFDRRYNERELSAGQHLLLVWTLLLHGEGEHVGPGSLVFVDEPERQLHPRAAVDVLSRLHDLIGPDGQLWIATHSPSIVAHFGGASLYYVEKNAIRFAGSRLDEIMDGLLGGSGGRRTMSDCLADAELLNLHRYAVEALFPAGVAGHRKADKQGTQLSGLVQRVFATANGRLRILDYAAGKARFAVALADALPTELRDRVDYFAFNERHHDEHHDECVRNVGRLHARDAESHVSLEISDFFGEDRVDLVVVSNLLHEVEPHEWKSHFGRAANVLGDTGLLVVMEDQEPAVGELPTREGFIVLDLTAMRTLFGRTTEVRALSDDDRLTALEIPRRLLQGYTGEHLRDALQETSDRAKAELRRLRAGGISGTPQGLGRRHAFYALLFASTQLALDGMPATAPQQRSAKVEPPAQN
jgi:hypothetical protein